MKHAFSLVAACAALLIVSSHRVGAQAVYGSIVGTVTDSSGGAVPNAKITITDIGRDVTTAAVANESGNFMQRYLIVGRYRVRVEAPGFKAFVQDNVNVSVDTEVRLETRLEVGEVNQTVEVSAEVGILKTERSDVATTYSDRVIENLPILNRRFTNFQLMTPGVVSFPTSLTAASAENPQGSYRMLVNGQSFAGTSHLLDGTDNHDAVLGWIVINPTLDSVTEAKITTANYDAEFGVASAGVVSAQTKSGTNQMHGTAFEFLRNDHIQARNPFTQSRVIPNSGGRLVPLTWNFTLQHQLSSTSSVEAAYVGTKGTHVFAGTGGDYDPNQADINGFGITNTNQRKPFFQKFGWSQNLRYYGSDASNSYHSLQLKFDKRFANGFNVMSHYTWSKNIDYDSTYYPQDARLARGVSANNRAHVFFVASLYEVPFGQGRRYLNTMAKPLDFLIGGWQLNGTYSWMAGQPFTPGYRDCNADRDTGWCRPDLIGDYHVADPGQFGWFATTSVPLTANGQVDGPWQRPQRGKFGTVGRDTIVGPAFSQWDMSFFKTFAVTEGCQIQFRAESFNFANHTNLANPNSCVDCPGVAGRIFGAFTNYVPRQWQLALKVQY